MSFYEEFSLIYSLMMYCILQSFVDDSWFPFLLDVHVYVS